MRPIVDDESDDQLPPYACVILLRVSDQTILLEVRNERAKNAAGKLTCFGGKREDGEHPLSTALRECQEELGWQPAATERKFRRACDLYVDGKLIAYFYEAEAPDDSVELTFEPGRAGEYMHALNACTDDRVSPWHRCVFQAWINGHRRADFVSPSE